MRSLTPASPVYSSRYNGRYGIWRCLKRDSGPCREAKEIRIRLQVHDIAMIYYCLSWFLGCLILSLQKWPS